MAYNAIRLPHGILAMQIDMVSQSSVSNTSTIRIGVAITADDGWGPSFSGSVDWATSIGSQGGTNGGAFTLNVGQGGTQQIVIYDTVVQHDSAGRCYLNAYGSIGATGTTVFGGGGTVHVGTWLPSIPQPDPDPVDQASQPTVSPTPVVAGETLSILTYRASTSYHHTLTYRFGDASGTIVTNLPTDYDWPVPMSLLEQIPDSESGSGTIYCTTYDGSRNLGTRSVQFTVEAGSDVDPTIGYMTTSEANSDVTIGAYVQGVSDVQVDIHNAQGVYGSTITDYRARIGNYTASGESATLPVWDSGTVEVTAEVTDSRGRTATIHTDITVLPYSRPGVSGVSMRRALSDGTVDDDGEWIRVDASSTVASLVVGGVEQNTVRWTVQTRERGTTSWANQGDFDGTAPVWTTHVEVGSFSATKSWDVRLLVQDAFSETVAAGVISTANVYMDLGSDGIGVGKYREQGALDVKGQIYQNDREPVVSLVDGKIPSSNIPRLDDIDFRRLLPDPKVSHYAGACPVTASSWSGLPNIPRIDFYLPYDAWVTISLGAWMTVTNGYVRAGIEVYDATTVDPVGGGGAWGEVIYRQDLQGPSSQAHISRTVRLNSGYNSINVMAYGTGTAMGCNYPVLQVTPLYWSKEGPQ